MGGDRAGGGGGGALSRSVWTPGQARWCPPLPPPRVEARMHRRPGAALRTRGGGLACSVAQGRARPRPQGWRLPDVSPHQSCCLPTPKYAGGNTTPSLPAFPLSQAWSPPAVRPCGLRVAARQWRSPEATGSPFGAASCARGSSTKRSPSGTRTLMPRGLSCECKYWQARTSTKVVNLMLTMTCHMCVKLKGTDY